MGFLHFDALAGVISPANEHLYMYRVFSIKQIYNLLLSTKNPSPLGAGLLGIKLTIEQLNI